MLTTFPSRFVGHIPFNGIQSTIRDTCKSPHWSLNSFQSGFSGFHGQMTMGSHQLPVPKSLGPESLRPVSAHVNVYSNLTANDQIIGGLASFANEPLPYLSIEAMHEPQSQVVAPVNVHAQGQDNESATDYGNQRVGQRRPASRGIQRANYVSSRKRQRVQKLQHRPQMVMQSPLSPTPPAPA